MFTYSEARTGFDVSTIYVRNQFRTAHVPWNGTNEEADSPDADPWSRNDGSSEGMSMGLYIRPQTISSVGAYLSKYTASGNLREWFYQMQSNGQVRLSLIDESEGGNPTALRNADVALTLNESAFIATTYDGSGGATAADGATLYKNGLVAASTATNNASYVAMEPLTSPMNVAMLGGAANLLDAYVSVLFFTHRVLSAVEVFNLNDIYVAMQRPQRSSLLAGVI